MSYDYKCFLCNYEIEAVFSVKDKPDRIICPLCQTAEMRSLIGTGGSVHADSAWIESVNGFLSGDGDRPITSRTEYNAALKAKGLVPCG